MAFAGLGPKSTVLHKIARKGNEHELLKLLKQGADVTARDAEGRTPLHLAVMRGHLGIIKRLLEYGGPVVLLSRDILNCTPVHLAAVQNQVQLISMLIAALLEDTGGNTPLHEVARRGCMQDFLGFLHLGWEIAACDGRNHEVLQLTEDASKTGLTAVQKILGWSVLHRVAMEGKVTEIERLVKASKVDVHIQSANTWSPLHYAAAYNQVRSIEALVKLEAKVDVRDSVGSTPLHVACGEGHLPAVRKLIALGGDPSAKDKDGCTPLYCASAWNRIEVVRLLHQLSRPSWDQSKESWAQSEEGRTAVHVAAEQGWVDLIRVLVTELGCQVDKQDSYKFTPLHSAANWGWVDAVSVLVDLNHGVDVTDYLGRTPLHYAALHGRVGAIERLVELGARLKECDTGGGYSPLHLAADAGQCEAVAKLIELGADTEQKTNKGWTCLQLATSKGPGNVDVIGLLVERGASLKPSADDKNFETSLHIAARAGREDVIGKLIRHGAPVGAQTKNGSTPLHYAAAFGQAHVIEPLVKAGCSVRSRDNARNTPLHLAAGCGFLDTVVKLIELGADLDARDMSECTPLQNTAHGTYSALAQVPPGVPTGSNGSLQELGSLSLRRTRMASAVLPKGYREDSESFGGMVPVRTGFAWATLGNSESLSSMYLNDLDASHSPSSGRTWKGAELMNLLKKATRGRRPSNLFFNQDGPLDSHRTDPAEKERFHRHRDDDDDEWDKWSHREFEREREGLELLLKKTEALQMSQMEQDRTRLVHVAEKLVKLGARIGARDNEGRTALHLAAGCGDKRMVLKLVELGADVNCRDSVGGMAMHHAAMANKKEMMFTLARLGCDWRAKADGIDGASPAFVLCGQHGKTTRQQKLLEAKLKRVYLEGEAMRSEKDCFDDAWDKKGEQQERYEKKMERADANMAALLEEVAAEAAAVKNRQSSTNRSRRKKQVKTSTDSAVPDQGNHPMLATNKSEAQCRGREDTVCDEKRQMLKAALDEAVSCANFVLEIGSATGRDAMMDVKEKMDQAIDNAQASNVGAKYAKKVRKKLQALVEALPEEDGVPLSGDRSGGESAHGTRQGASKDDDEGWVTAQSGSRRRQSSQRNNAQQGENGRRSMAKKFSSYQQTDQYTTKLCGKPFHRSATTKGLTSFKSTTNGICSPRKMEEAQKMVLASIPKPCEKALIQHKIDGENEITQPDGIVSVVRASSVDSGHGRQTKSATWDQRQKSFSAVCASPLSDPDFPPLQSSVPSSLTAHPAHERSSSRALDADKRSISQESGLSCNKADSVSGITVHPTPDTVATTPSNPKQPAEHYPQYELFGASASPSLTVPVSCRPFPEHLTGSIVGDVVYSTSGGCPFDVRIDAAAEGHCEQQLSAAEHVDGLCATKRTDALHRTNLCSDPDQVMFMVDAYSTERSYRTDVIQTLPSTLPAVPVHVAINHEAMSQFSAYSCARPAPVFKSAYLGHPDSSAAHSPTESVAMRVARQCLNSEEIADKLPKEIPGLVESESEDVLTPRCSVSCDFMPAGGLSELSGPVPRHLLGDLAFELGG